MKNAQETTKELSLRYNLLKAEYDIALDALQKEEERMEKEIFQILLSNLPGMAGCNKTPIVKVSRGQLRIKYQLYYINDKSFSTSEVTVSFDDAGKANDVSMPLHMTSLKNVPNLVNMREALYILSRDIINEKGYIKQIEEMYKTFQRDIYKNSLRDSEMRNIKSKLQFIEKCKESTEKLREYFLEEKTRNIGNQERYKEFNKQCVELFLKDRDAVDLKRTIAPGFSAAGLNKKDAVIRILENLYV